MLSTQRTLKLVLVPLAVLLCLLFVLNRIGKRIEFPEDQKVMDVTGQSQKASWRPPAGKLYSIPLASSGPSEQSPKLSGTVRLLGNKGVLFEQRFGPDDLQVANWLDRAGRSSVIIGNKPHTMNVDDVMIRNRQLELELLLDETPVPPLELWASWLTSKSIEREVEAARADLTHPVPAK